MKYIILALLMAAMPYSPLFQSDFISGIVTDASDGSPIQGVSVQWKGETASGVVTDQNGNFTIKRSAKSNFLIFSYVGY